MLPTINEFVSKYGLENFVVVVDYGLMNNANIAELEAHGYKYIIGAKINIQTTVQRKRPITERREYAGWKRLTSMVRSLKATSTKEIGPMVSLYTQTHRSSYMHLKLPLNKEIYTQTMLMARHQKMAKLFDEDFWVTQ